MAERTGKDPHETDILNEGKDDVFMDIDRMVNEGLGGGTVTRDNGLIEDTTTDTMFQAENTLDGVEESIIDAETESFMKKKNG